MSDCQMIIVMMALAVPISFLLGLYFGRLLGVADRSALDILKYKQKEPVWEYEFKNDE